MCGFFAFSTNKSPRAISDMFEISNLPRSEQDIQSLKFFPKAKIPTISKNSPNQLVMRYWSLIPRWWQKPVEDLKFSTFNARSEEIATKASYKQPWQDGQRCLIPSTWFYEFAERQKDGKTFKQPYRVEAKDEIMTLAGLYEGESVTILTCQAAGKLAKVHHRQPVIIKQEDREAWLESETDLAVIEKMLVPEPDLEVKEIDRQFNKAFGGEVTVEMVGGE